MANENEIFSLKQRVDRLEKLLDETIRSYSESMSVLYPRTDSTQKEFKADHFYQNIYRTLDKLQKE